MLTLTNLAVLIHGLRMGRYVKTAVTNIIISYDPRTVLSGAYGPPAGKRLS
jgi:hypothetical protein